MDGRVSPHQSGMVWGEGGRDGVSLICKPNSQQTLWQCAVCSKAKVVWLAILAKPQTDGQLSPHQVVYGVGVRVGALIQLPTISEGDNGVTTIQ